MLEGVCEGEESIVHSLWVVFATVEFMLDGFRIFIRVAAAEIRWA